MQTPNTIVAERLNHLVAILDDSSEGYLTAAEYARDKELEKLLEKLSYQRNDFLMQIKNIIQSMGADTYSKGGFLSLLHRTWKDMCFKLKSRDKSIVKTCCVIGEKFTICYYESILNDPQMPGFVKKVLATQLNNIYESVHQFQTLQLATITSETSHEKPAAVADNPEKKILFLIAYLKQAARDFDMIADEINDKNLQTTFITITEEYNQFAEELNCQVRHYGFNISGDSINLLPDYSMDTFDNENTFSKKNELLQICDKSEYLFLKLYTDALKEFLSFKHFSDIMAYQYNSIKAGFLKLRMLHSIRFNH